MLWTILCKYLSSNAPFSEFLTIERALQNPFWRPQKVRFVWSVPISSKGDNRVWTNRKGAKRIISRGGSKPVFGEESYGMFSPCP